jgi:hypothetical protein
MSYRCWHQARSADTQNTPSTCNVGATKDDIIMITVIVSSQLNLFSDADLH